MKVFGFLPLSLCDWPGRCSFVIFLGGCNINCSFCHNKDVVRCETTIPVEIVLEELFKHSKYLDGCVISGGEPLIHDDIMDLINKIRMPVKIDTNGTRPEMIEKLIPYVDLFAIDIKATWDKYPIITNSLLHWEGRLKVIFKMAEKYPEKFYFRTTAIPDLTEDDLKEIQSYIPYKLHIQEYRRPNERK